MHRVIDIGVVRYSSAFFAEPRFDTLIPSNVLVPEEEQTMPPEMFGKWQLDLLKKKYVEWRDCEIEIPDE